MSAVSHRRSGGAPSATSSSVKRTQPKSQEHDAASGGGSLLILVDHARRARPDPRRRRYSRSSRLGSTSTATGFTLGELRRRLRPHTDVLTWLQQQPDRHARARCSSRSPSPRRPATCCPAVASRLVSGYSLLLFVVQSLPVITAVIPLFILFAGPRVWWTP